MPREKRLAQNVHFFFTQAHFHAMYPAPVAAEIEHGIVISETDDATESESDLGMPKMVEQLEADVRRGFIRKVYGILIAQLLVTVGIAAPFQSLSKEWIEEHLWMVRLARWTSLAVVLVLACCRGTARSFPANYMFLFAFTACQGVVIGFVSAMYQTHSVLLAAGLTVALFSSLTAYACLTKSDFTGAGPYLFCALSGLCLAGFVLLFFPGSEGFFHVYACLGAMLFCFYIVYDTQLIIGGQHKKFKFEVDDYVFAALNIYLDIVDLFLFLLSLLGDRK